MAPGARPHNRPDPFPPSPPLNELMRLTRIELCNLAQRITNELPTSSADSLGRANALTSLCNIRIVLARRDFSP